VTAFFFDSSSLVKRYIAETGSAWVNQLLDPAATNRIYLLRLTGVELVAAIARRRRGRSLTADRAAQLLEQFRNEFGSHFQIVEVTRAVLNEATELADAHSLRAYDAVQLAAVLDLNRRRVTRGFSDLALVSSDLELNAVAATVGLSVEDPNQHP
jgi:predicted nucleic acid-binding protein